MNYLKTISKINKAEFLHKEAEAKRIEWEACQLIKEIAQKMYDREISRTKYIIWQAIADLTDSIKYQY